AVLAADIDGDQRPDLYVANDTTDNFLYLNRSEPGKIRLKEVGGLMGVAQADQGRATGSMGLDCADIDGSGLPSLWVTTYEHELPSLFRMQLKHGKRQFLYASQASGMSRLGLDYVGWGTKFLDLDNRGVMDLVISN